MYAFLFALVFYSSAKLTFRDLRYVKLLLMFLRTSRRVFSHYLATVSFFVLVRVKLFKYAKDAHNKNNYYMKFNEKGRLGKITTVTAKKNFKVSSFFFFMFLSMFL